MSDPKDSKKTKTRTGCGTCKVRRVKCDETRPFCKQCGLKRLDCPGYQRPLIWSLKHEKFATSDCAKVKTKMKMKNIAPQVSEIDKRASNPPSSSTEALNPRTDPSASETQDPNSWDVLIGSIFYESPISCNEYVAAGEVSDLQSQSPLLVISDFFPADEDIAIQGLVQENDTPSSNERVQGQVALYDRLKAHRRYQYGLPLNSWSTDAILCSPSLLVDFFSDTVCRSINLYDSPRNPFRTATLSRLKDSLLFDSLSRYSTVAYLAAGSASEEEQLLFQQARTETLFRLHNAVAATTGMLTLNSEKSDLLLAIIMFGLTTSWDGSNDPGILHYNAAISIFDQYSSAVSSRSGMKQFFHESLIYWWMGLCFSCDREVDNLLDPPPLPSVGTNDERTARRAPHPLTGVTPCSFLLMGRVGSLIYSCRLRARSLSFTSLQNITKEFQALQSAQALEEELLSLQIPSKSRFIDESSGCNTLIDDLLRVGDAYRLAALLLLYQAFPDLLDKRLGSVNTSEYRESDPANQKDFDHREREQQQRQWLRSLALHILDEKLEQNSPHSGVRSVEQILLVILAGALSSLPEDISSHQSPRDPIIVEEESWLVDRSSDSSIVLEHQTASIPTPSPPAPVPLTSFPPLDHDQDQNILLLALPGALEHPIIPFSTNPETQHGSLTLHPQTLASERRKILSRVGAVREVLPYKSVEYTQHLVEETWRRMDLCGGRVDVFWIDVMIEKGWKFLMA